MLHSSKGYLRVETDVPCAPSIETWLRVRHAPLDRLVAPSRRFEPAYLAWETVRKARNPFFAEGTGFEGYYVGVYASPDEMLTHLLELGHSLLEANYRLYRFNAPFRNRLMRALTGENLDHETISVWSDLLGATLARLRCNVYAHPKASEFQAETYRMTSRLKPVSYCQCDFTINQTYVLPFFLADRGYRIGLDLEQLKPSDYEAGLVVDKIGQFGHPLVREYLRQRTQRITLE